MRKREGESFYYKFFFRFNERVERQVTTLIMIMALNNKLMRREQRKNKYCGRNKGLLVNMGHIV